MKDFVSAESRSRVTLLDFKAPTTMTRHCARFASDSKLRRSNAQPRVGDRSRRGEMKRINEVQV